MIWIPLGEKKLRNAATQLPFMGSAHKLLLKVRRVGGNV